jgi:hypothetical protein
MSFLQAITMRHPEIKCDWSTQRKNFKVVFSQNSKLSVKVDNGEKKKNPRSPREFLNMMASGHAMKYEPVKEGGTRRSSSSEKS